MRMLLWPALFILVAGCATAPESGTQGVQAAAPPIAFETDAYDLSGDPRLENSVLVVPLNHSVERVCEGNFRLEWKGRVTGDPDISEVGLVYQTKGGDCEKTESDDLTFILEQAWKETQMTGEQCYRGLLLHLHGREPIRLVQEDCIRDDGPQIVPGSSDQEGGLRGR